MKKSIIISLLLMLSISVSAQKFALIDMEYILDKIPTYTEGMQQLEQASKKYQAEIENLTSQTKSLYDQYQKQAKSLSESVRAQREKAIIDKEKEMAELRKKYFGPDGEMNKKREAIMAPIQNKIYEAVKQISTARGYSMVLDRAADSAIFFATPSIDISNEVLAKMGYSN